MKEISDEKERRKIPDFKEGCRYSGDFKTRLLCYDIDRKMNYMQWCDELPFIQWPSHYQIKVIPPFGAKIIRFKLKANDTPIELSIYLDAYNYSGYMPWPYWEIFGGNFEQDVSRCKWDDIEKLKELVNFHFYGV